MVSGVADLGHGIIPYSTSKTHRKEYRVLVSNNASTAENRFNRSKSVSEFEEDVEENFSGTVSLSPVGFSAGIASVSYKKKNLDYLFRRPAFPIFLMHHQILV